MRSGRIEPGFIRMERGSVLQLSTYMTLALAAVCLGFADMFFLRWMPWFLTALGLVFVLAWRNEGRWQLSESAANSLGLVIAFAALTWIVVQLPRSEEELIAAGIPWPAGLLPHVAPLLMILTAVKLFRPKHVPDFWSLQILAVMMVTLASVLAGEFDHGIWIILYLIAQVWCLASFYQSRSRWIHLSTEERQRTPLFGDTTAPAREPRTRGLGIAATWSAVIVLLGVSLFVGIPRQGTAQWIPHKLSALASGRLAGGLDNSLDLNRTDKVELSNEVAFEFDAIDARGVSGGLPPDTYWRADTFDVYINGRWYCANHVAEQSTELNARMGMAADAIKLEIVPTGNWEQPRDPRVRPDDMPADRLYISVHALPMLAGNLVCAEPVDVERVGLLPLTNERPSRTSMFAYLRNADLIVTHARRTSYRYGLGIDPAQNPLRQRANPLQRDYRSSMLVQGPPESMALFARELVRRVDGLTEEERTLDDDGRVALKHHDRVAQAITRHFASSGEYLYSLNRKRVDMHIDPNVDFLTNVKEGHCERYASGLALTLRALGIPARVVHGFHGNELGEDGVYRVRFTHAHSWVQALVPAAKGGEFDWLLLDGTPSEEAPISRWQRFSEFLSDAIRALRSGFHNGVLEYGANTPIVELRRLWDAATAEDLALVGAALSAIVLLIAGWRWGQTPIREWFARYLAGRVQRLHAPWLSQALDLIRRKADLSPASSETLLEFAERLRGHGSAPLVEPFERIAAFAHRVRFGRSAALNAADAAAIETALADLRHAAASL